MDFSKMPFKVMFGDGIVNYFILFFFNGSFYPSTYFLPLSPFRSHGGGGVIVSAQKKVQCKRLSFNKQAVKTGTKNQITLCLDFCLV